MDRCGLFVDAGYLMSEGGALCLGATSRQDITCDYGAVVQALMDFAEQHSGHPALRVYWYDGAPDAIPLPWHQRIADLPFVKLRMGRIVGEKKNRRQKGVDSLIVRDLIVLARERAVCTAYLLAGDEDLREGVATAQEQGLQVVVLGIQPTSKPRNQAQTLIREADDHIVLDPSLLRPHFSDAAPRPSRPPAARAAPPGSVPPSDLGAAFARAWAEKADPEDLAKLLDNAPRIPVELDVELIKNAEETLGSLRSRDKEKRELRRGFWSTIRGGLSN